MQRPIRPGRTPVGRGQPTVHINVSKMLANYLGGDTGGQENQPVSPEIQPANYSGPPQYYGQGGQVTTMPMSSTLNWFGKLTGQPDASEYVNTQAALGNVANAQSLQALKAKSPIELANKVEEAKQLAKIQNDASTEHEIAQYKLNREQGKVPIPLSAPLESGDYPYDQEIESPEIERRNLQKQKLTFLPYNTAGIQGNADIAEKSSMAKYREAEANRLARPEHFSVGNTVFTSDKNGNIVPNYQVPEPVHWEKTFQINDKTGKPEETYKPFGGGRPINLQPKVLGNVYGGGSGISNSILPAEGYGYNPTKMSHSIQNFVMKVGDNGKPMEVPSQAEPPKVQPEVEPPFDYGRPQSAPTHRLRPGGNPQALQEQIANETAPTNEMTEQEKLIKRLNQILQGTGRY